MSTFAPPGSVPQMPFAKNGRSKHRTTNGRSLQNLLRINYLYSLHLPEQAIEPWLMLGSNY